MYVAQNAKKGQGIYRIWGERPAASLGRNTRKGSMGWFLSKTSTSCIDSRPEKQEKHGNLTKLPRGREEKLVCLGSKSKLRLAWRSLLVLPCCMILKLPLNTTDCSFSGSVDRLPIVYLQDPQKCIFTTLLRIDGILLVSHCSCVSHNFGFYFCSCRCVLSELWEKSQISLLTVTAKIDVQAYWQ